MKQEKNKGKFIYYDGKYWLVEKYNQELYEGGFFAVPIYFLEDHTAEVRHGGSNWCYKCNGAFLKNPEKKVINQAYESQLKHLNWCKSIQIKSTDYYESTNNKINKQIKFYEDLLKNEK